MLQLSVVGGVSSDAQRHPKPSASSPTLKQAFTPEKDKNIDIYKYISRYSNPYIHQTKFYLFGDHVDRIDLHKSATPDPQS
jgi:hypothetical protein